jgi:hypothetical protein
MDCFVINEGQHRNYHASKAIARYTLYSKNSGNTLFLLLYSKRFYQNRRHHNNQTPTKHIFAFSLKSPSLARAIASHVSFHCHFIILLQFINDAVGRVVVWIP